MTTIQKALAGLALVVVLAMGVLWAVKRHDVSTGNKAEAQAAAFKAEANATTAAAVQTDAKVELIHKANAPDQARVDRDRAEVKRLTDVVASEPDTTPRDDPRLELDQAKDVLIADLITQVEGLKTENAALLEDRNQWRATADLRLKQAQAQEAATTAWKHAVTESRWLGRGEGGLIGFGLGLLKGRK